ncbi:MAG: efflux RND transporter periplasmic adaptor subunit, partial [Gemmataceae bacterium]
DRVGKGDVLAVVDAAEVGRVKAEFLQAYAQLDVRTRILAQQRSARGSIPERTIQETEATVREARVRLLSAQQALINLGLPIDIDRFPMSASEEQMVDRLRFLGLPEQLTKELDPKTTTANLLPLRTSLDGIVVERHVVTGEVVSTEDVLFVVANTETMWLNLDVRFEDAGSVRLGQRVVFKPDGSKQEVEGRVTWISTAANEKTRTIRVRAELPNPDGKLRGQTFGSGRIILRDVPETMVVPNEAIHWEGDCNVVFVRDRHFLEKDAPKIFHVRTVRLGAKDDKNTEIIAGVLPGEVVATKGSGILRSELLKNNLGAG